MLCSFIKDDYEWKLRKEEINAELERVKKEADKIKEATRKNREKLNEIKRTYG